jgi:hypothetical protein
MVGAAQKLGYHLIVVPGPERGLAAAAAGVCTGVALSFLPAARLLHYAKIGLSDRGAALVWMAPLAVFLAILYERVVRGSLYGALGRRLAVGNAAPAVAFLGALVPAAIRLWILPRGGAPPVILAGHAFLVESGLGLALALLALGTGSTLPGGFTYGAIWAVRLAAAVTFHGSVVPLLETAAAWASAIAVALVLSRPLAPWREEVFG